MFTRKAAQHSMVITLAGLMAVGCSPRSATEGETASTQAQSPPIPDYPPLYNVDVNVCGDIIAPLQGDKRCISTKLQLWGPVSEAKLVRAGVALPAVSAVEHKVAIASKGCYPAYSQPSQEQFYSADTVIQVNRGGRTTIEVKPTQLTNQQVHALITGRSASPGILTFGGVGCEPVATN